MKNLVVAIMTFAVWGALPVQAAPPTMSFDEVRTGQKGTGRTVFAGTTLESFDVEIIGKLPNIGPQQNLILARLSGGPLAHTGVLQGMSGSPVTIEGKLIGAVAYSWGFSKDAIAGITPIAEMLAVAQRGGIQRRARSGGSVLGPDWRHAFHDANAMSALWQRQLDTLAMRPAASAVGPLPLSVSGVGVQGLRRISASLERAGFTALQAAGSDRDAPAPALEPGSPVGLKLVRGDVEMAATGTVTWVDAEGVLAFGHPLFGLGAVDLPLTAARVETLLPSLSSSARLAVPLGEVGALREDRAAAVYGRLGAQAQMIPIRVQLESDAASKTFSFDVADDPLLAPVLFYLSLNGILGGAERTVGNLSLRLREGSVIKMADGEDVALDNLFSGAQALDYATGIPAYILHLLMNNVWSAPRIVGVNIILEYDESPRTTRLTRVVADRYRVTAGDSVDLELIFASFRGPRRTVHTSVRIPDGQAPGTLTLLVAGAGILQREEQIDEPLFPRDLAQLVQMINRLRRNDRAYIVAVQPDAGVFVDGSRLSNLPPSVATVLARPGGHSNRGNVNRRHVLEESVAIGDVVEGTARLELEIVPR